MESKIKFDRVLLNVLFYIFYVLLVSIAFSFVFPTILIIFGQEVLNPSNPIFDSIQIGIIILMLIFTIIYRKYCYLPISNKHVIEKVQKLEKVKTKKVKNKLKAVKEEKIVKKITKKVKLEKTLELDIKIGKEIK
ncbi:MAG: hypothetical protein QM490_02260 [Candidatus Gracilibacteria bacterium]